MAIPTIIHMTSLPDVSASWSGRNGGQVMLLGGGVRGILSRDVAQSIVDKLSRALSAPQREAEMAGRDVVPDPERVAAPDTMLAEPMRHRKGALIDAFPSHAQRLGAIALALEHSDAGAEVVAIGGVYFTRDEAEAMMAALTADQIGRRAN